MTHTKTGDIIMVYVETIQKGESYNATFEVYCDGVLMLTTDSIIDAMLKEWELEEAPELTMSAEEILGVELESYDWDMRKTWRPSA